MSREDYLAQRIRNLESDKDNLISILVVKLWCPKQAAIFDGFDKECMSPDTCGTPPENCWQEFVEGKRPPEIYSTSEIQSYRD